MKSNSTNKSKSIVYLGLFSCLCAAATFIKIPFGAGAMVHLGSAMIFIIAIIFGGKYAGISGAIGSALFDLLMGFSPYTILSFFIKGIAGLLAGKISHIGKYSGENVVVNIVALVISSIWTLVTYFGAWIFIQGSFQAAIINIPSTLLTSGIGIIIAIPFSHVLKKTLSKTNYIDKVGK